MTPGWEGPSGVELGGGSWQIISLQLRTLHHGGNVLKRSWQRGCSCGSAQCQPRAEGNTCREWEASKRLGSQAWAGHGQQEEAATASLPGSEHTLSHPVLSTVPVYR